MNSTAKTILLVAGLGAVAFIGYAIYKKTTAKNVTLTPIPSAPANTSGGQSNTIHDIADGIGALAGLYGAFTSGSKNNSSSDTIYEYN